MTYEADQKYKVIKTGAKLVGNKSIRGGYEGYQRLLNIDDVIVCGGSGWTPGDGVPAMHWMPTEEERTLGVWGLAFSPHKGGMWSGVLPEDGYLELVP